MANVLFFMGLGILTSVMGYNVTNWQFWAILLYVALGTTLMDVFKDN